MSGLAAVDRFFGKKYIVYDRYYMIQVFIDNHNNCNKSQ